MRKLTSVGSHCIAVILLLLCFTTMGQCPSASFDSETFICQGQSTTFTNNSLNSVSYLWDFDAGDLSLTPEASGLATFSVLSTTTNIEVVLDTSTDNWYGFASSRGTDLIYRLDFGTDIESVPALIPLTIANLNSPEGFKVYREDDNWYALVHNAGASTLSRIDFGSSLESDNLTADALVTVGALNSTLDLVESADSLIAVVTNFTSNSVSFVPFGNSILNNPAQVDVFTTSAISGASGLMGTDVFYDCGNWFGVVNGFSSKTSHLLEFGSDLFTNPTVTEIANSGLLTSNPTRTEVRREGGKYIAIVSSRGGILYRFDLGEDNLVQIELTESLGNLGVLNRLQAFTLVQDSSRWYGFGINTSNDALYNVKFPSVLDSNPVSDEVNGSFTFNQLGTYTIQLSAYDADGQVSFYSEEITVNDVPTGDFTISEGCVDTDFTFSGSSTASITSWNWDFGDGNSDNGQVVNHNYALSGSYQVKLTISDGICDSTIVKQLEVFDSPPAPSFDISASSFCANSEITFTNTTDDASYTGPLEYEWNFNGEGTADTKDATFSFSTPGSKTITLRSIVNDCEASDMQIIVLQVGSVADYSYTNNCFGEPIQFTDQSTGTITDYFWDFGDGNNSTLQSPSHQYASAGTYTVTLSIINSDGCESSVAYNLEYSDGPLASISVGEAIENLPISFNGSDITGSDDFVTSWSWDFDGLGISNQQVTSFTFPSAQDYTVTLTVQTNQGCEFQVDQIVPVMQSTCPMIDYTIPTEVCIGERLNILNQSVNANTYEWTFCSQDLTSTPTISEIDSAGLFSSAFGMDLVNESGVNYLFGTSSGIDQVNRVDYSGDFGSEATITPLGALTTNPSGIRLVQLEETWYGLLLSTNGTLSRLTFGDITNETPIVEEISGLTSINNARGLLIIEESDLIYAMIVGGSQLQVLRFSSGFEEAPDEVVVALPGGSFANSIALFDDCGTWYGLIGSSTSETIHVEFNLGLFDIPTFTTISGTPNSGGCSIISIDQNYFGIISNVETNGFTILDFGSMLSNTSPTLNPANAFETNGASIGLEFLRINGHYRGISMDLSGGLYSIDFDAPCNLFSGDYQPTDISYFNTGNYEITLFAKNDFGREVSQTQMITVSSATAPDIAFAVDESRCISNISSFTPTIPGLTSYSWDFNSDGIEDSNQESPTFDYSTLGSGTYTVRLDVSDGSCDNFVEEEITIYDPPAVPSYNVTSTLFCLNTDINFANTTSDGTYEGPLTYLWEFIDDESGAVVGNSTNKDAAFAFVTAGQKTIRLTSSIPGCEEITEQTININPGPTADFFAPTVCQNEAMQFANTSTSGVSYLWNFGDGVTSTNENPSHVYTEAGNYNVQLTTTDALGCDASQVIEVAVSALPSVDFEFTVACNSAEGVQFTDQTTIENADVIAWSWMVDGSEVSTVQNPTLLFPEGGTRNVSLVVTGSNGCTATYNEAIEILSAPIPDFTVAVGCQGETTLLNDASVSSGNPVVSWLWDVNGESYTTNDVEHIFADPGTYEVTLEVTAQNFCSESITKAVEILQLPEVNFSIQGGCDNEVILTEDLSTEFVDPINVRRWMIDGANVGSGSQLFLQNLAAGTYDIVLEVETEAGCVTSSTQPLIINAAPDADFTFDRNYGIPGDQIGFTNTSNGGTSFQWLLDGEEFSTSAISQNFIFEEPGIYLVSLVSQNDLGCSDTTNQEVLIAVPEVDLRIGSFDLVQEGNIGKIFFEIENQSNLPVERIEAIIELENQFSVTEEVNQLIGIGETVLVGLDVGIPLVASQTTYFCVNLASQYNGYDDVDPLNNEKCLTVEPQITVEDPYPNPVTDQFRVRVVVPEEQPVNVTLINSTGKTETEKSFEGDIGLNSYFIDMSALNPGIYFVNIEVGNQTFRRKVIKF